MKRLGEKTAILLVICLLCALCSGYGVTDGEACDYSRLRVYVDGTPEYVGYDVRGILYVPLRSFSQGLRRGAVVTWCADSDTMEVSFRNEESEAPPHTMIASVGNCYLYVNDRAVYLGGDVMEWNGNLLVPLQPLCRAFGVTVSADTEAAAVHLDTQTFCVCQRGSEVYEEEELYWLSRIIHAEAANQSMDGKIGVGNVVLNRVADERFPDTVEKVIFAPGQFCPVTHGYIYCDPDEAAVAAAKLCLEGVSLVGPCTYFVNPTTGVTSWFEENLTFSCSIEDHDFYF